MVNQLHIESFCLGDWQTNCYVLHRELEDENTAHTSCWIIDAGFRPDAMINYIRSKRLGTEAGGAYACAHRSYCRAP